jgi:hypothetical protein
MAEGAMGHPGLKQNSLPKFHQSNLNPRRGGAGILRPPPAIRIPVLIS